MEPNFILPFPFIEIFILNAFSVFFPSITIGLFKLLLVTFQVSRSRSKYPLAGRENSSLISIPGSLIYSSQNSNFLSLSADTLYIFEIMG